MPKATPSAPRQPPPTDSRGRHRLGVDIDKKLFIDLKVFCARTEQQMRDAVENAIREYVSK